jgi:predicted acyltransferase (DUF342 family)
MVYGLGILSLALMSTVLTSVLTNLSTHKNSLSGLYTLVTADSGAREGVQQLILGTEPVSGTILNPIGVTNTSVSVLDALWVGTEVIATAENNLTQRKVSYTVITQPGAGAFAHAIYAQHDVEVGGNACVTGDIYAGNNLDVTNAAVVVAGEVYSSGETTIHENATVGQSTANVVVLSPPTVDLSQYYTDSRTGIIATSTDSVSYADSVSHDAIYFPNASWAEDYLHKETRTNKLVYVEDSGTTIQLGNQTNFTGTLIVLGDLKITAGTYATSTNPVENNPLVIYVGGNLELTGGNIHGVVYVLGETTVSHGNPTITGSLIGASPSSTIGVNGNLIVVYNASLAESWENIEGIDVSGSPIFMGWTEI